MKAIYSPRVALAGLAVGALCFIGAPAGAQELFYDFGETAQQTPGNYNNMTQAQIAILNSIDSSGNATGISMTVTDAFWPGSNQNGPTTPSGAAGAIFDPQATRDNLFGNTVVFGGSTEPTAAVLLGGLDATGNTQYSFTFFASRLGVTDIREAEYAVSGLNSSTVYLDASNNTSNVVVASGLIPDAAGQITIAMGPGPNNNNSSGFYYLGAIRMEGTIIPEPVSGAAMLAVAGLASLRRRRN